MTTDLTEERQRRGDETIHELLCLPRQPCHPTQGAFHDLRPVREARQGSRGEVRRQVCRDATPTRRALEAIGQVRGERPDVWGDEESVEKEVRCEGGRAGGDQGACAFYTFQPHANIHWDLGNQHRANSSTNHRPQVLFLRLRRDGDQVPHCSYGQCRTTPHQRAESARCGGREDVCSE